MKTIISMLFGIATLFGSASSIATDTTSTTEAVSGTAADEECFLHVVTGLYVGNYAGARRSHIVIGDISGDGDFHASVSAYSKDGVDIVPVHSKISGNLTIPEYGSVQIRDTHVQGGDNEYGVFRNIRIFTDKDAHVRAWTLENYRAYSVEVYKRELTNEKDWVAPCETDSKS